ncbi:MAG: signal peptide peptidase SppA [Bacteroidales bacterium]|nr:signal peptide peptidase SppA [Bacteroidales bacterium]
MEENFENPIHEETSQNSENPSEKTSVKEEIPTPKKGRKREKPTKPFRQESRARKFWRVVFGSLLGFVFANIVLSFLGIFMLISLIGSVTVSIPKDSILELTLDAPVVERSNDMNFTPSIYGQTKTIGLDDILSAVRNAQQDEKILGISLNLTSVSASPATLEEIRQALADFKKSGKFVYAYGDTYSQSAYYIASVADKVYLNPQGSIDFRGMCMQTMFYKGLIDKLDVDVQIVKHGRYKSAVEPYFREDMSEASREQSEALVASIWGKFCQDISSSRKISVERLNEIADSMMLSRGVDALDFHMVDALASRTEYNKALRLKTNKSANDVITLVGLDEYKQSWKIKSPSSRADKIAIVYAVGEIIDGNGSATVIGSNTLSADIRKAYKDKTVKAIVLRVNSPGGSALASEVIASEIEQAKAAGKVVIVSMGDYAASGGYYISCGADAIVAQPTTITGSIGVFGMIPSFGRFLSEKLGVTIDGVATNAHSDALNGFRPMDEKESEYMQNSVDETYRTFLGRVAKGRGMTMEEVDSVGMGRVWTGADAMKIGLVNQLGNLHDAIVLAANKAHVSDYELVCYPAKKTFLEVLTEEKDHSREIEAAYRAELGELYPAFVAMRQLRHLDGVQARLPMEIMIK